MVGKKLMAANRGEIAVRILRAGRDEGLGTVGIYAENDRHGGHLPTADEECLIGSKGQFGPNEAYLNIGEVVKCAKASNVDLVHPGYGFLSENAEFAKAVREAGIKFVGPTPEAIEQMGNKVRARSTAKKCGVPIIPGTEGPVKDLQDALNFTERYGFPVIIKASAGGGGRGMRVVNSTENLQRDIESASKEALAAFGDGEIFLERYLRRPKHLEVQILGDSTGNVIHLFERDCSVQRKYQKIIEVAPAVSLDDTLRQSILGAAVRLGNSVRYENAGTVEFLVEGDKFYFIEMNPRIQVEHTVTEQVTGVDLIRAQLKIAMGASLADLGLTQDSVALRGVSIQCRVTTEVPAQDFRPDTGTLEVFKIPSGNGVRVDSAFLREGSVISPYYDPLLVKCITYGSTLVDAVSIMRRALREFQVRGVETNIPYLVRVLEDEQFLGGKCWTTFLQDTPDLADATLPVPPIEKLLSFFADTVVNGSHIIGQVKPPATLRPLKAAEPVQAKVDSSSPMTNGHVTNGHMSNGVAGVNGHGGNEGWRYLLVERGPKEFAKAIRKHRQTLITDTTWRDGQQSLLATRVRTRDLLEVSKATSYAYRKAYSLECWGGATFDVAYRFLFEDPWKRLRLLRKAIPNIPFQMLLRSTNGLAYSALPDNAIFHFVRHAKEAGMDIFRVFDSLNNIENLKVGIDAVIAADAVAEGAIMYTGDMLGGSKYTLEYYMDVVDKLVGLGIHILSIKSMSGVMKPSAGRILVQTIRNKYPDLPIHMHTHDTNGAGVTTMVACAEAGADIVDTAIDSLSGTTSQPSVGAVVASLQHTSYRSELELEEIAPIDAYWAQLRLMYAGFDAELRSPDSTVYQHEIPGGQYSNLVFQARQLGLGSQWEETKKAYTEANLLLGDIIKATPTSKAVGDLAQFMVDNKLTPEKLQASASRLDFPGSVIDFLDGHMGEPFDGFPEPLRSDVLRKPQKASWARPGLSLKSVDFEEVRREIKALFPRSDVTEYDVSSYIMFPEVFKDFCQFRETFGDVADIPTEHFFTIPTLGRDMQLTSEDGRDWTITLVAIGPTDEVTAKKDVFFRVNGELRAMRVLDREAQPVESREKIDPKVLNDVGSPMAAKVSRIFVSEEDSVKKGDIVAMVTAMKMEIKVSARASGTVSKIAVAEGDAVEKDDLLVRLTPTS